MSDRLIRSGKIEEIIFARFQPGEDILQALYEICVEKDIKTGVILDGSGSAVNFTYQHFPVNPKMAPTNVVIGTMEGKCEISLQGTIGTTVCRLEEGHDPEDVIAGIALYRPGPMDSIPTYIRAKNNPDTISYDCPQLEPILSPTYGCIVYQEQVMQIVRDLAGYSLGRSDLVRRAMSKKKVSVMEEERRRFVYGDEAEGVKGCIANGIDEAVANHIFDEMIDFARYAFNKSHAASYAVVAYQTAYLKYYYPVEFFAALMTSIMENTSKISQYIATCRANGITVLPPDVNTGSGTFVAVDGQIRYGMYAVRSVGRPMIDTIVEERKANGPYRTLEEFVTRLDGRDVNRRAIENLIKAGALDSLEGYRSQKVYALTRTIDAVNSERKTNLPGQMSLFDLAGEEARDDFKAKLPETDEFDKEELLAFEKEVLGIYVSGHPLEDDVSLMEKNATATSADFLYDPQEEQRLRDDQHVVVGGMIIESRLHFTKKNDAMAFVTIEDLYGTIEVLVFPSVFDKFRALLEEDRKVFIEGRATLEEERDAKLIASKIYAFDELPKELWIQFENKNAFEGQKARLASLLMESEGDDTVILYIRSPKSIRRLPVRWNVHVNDDYRERLVNAFGEDNIRVMAGKIK